MNKTFLRALVTAGAMALAACSSSKGGSPAGPDTQGYSANGTWLGSGPPGSSDFQVRLAMTQSGTSITGTGRSYLGGDEQTSFTVTGTNNSPNFTLALHQPGKADNTTIICTFTSATKFTGVIHTESVTHDDTMYFVKE